MSNKRCAVWLYFNEVLLNNQEMGVEGLSPTPSPTSLAFLQAATWHHRSVKWSSEQSGLGRGNLAGQTRVLQGYWPSQASWSPSAITCGVVVTELFRKDLRGQKILRPVEAARMRILPGIGPVPAFILSSPSHVPSCPACCSVCISVLTHGHASLRPRKRP